MGKQRFKNLFVVFTAALWVHGSLGSLRAESAFWDERRAQSVRQKSLPERSGRLQLAALPTPHRITLASPDPADSRSAGNPLGFPIPLEFGSVRKITSPHVSRSSSVVLHIQDVHHNEAAQRKIGRAIESLVSNGSIGLVALEGASGPIEMGGIASVFPAGHPANRGGLFASGPRYFRPRPFGYYGKPGVSSHGWCG
jgi:hypothetical protein